jgi:hypothetical protein
MLGLQGLRIDQERCASNVAILPFLQLVRVVHPSVADNSGALGSGLAIFTRYPLVAARVMPYNLSGTPQQAIAGDFFVNKAAASVVVLHPTLGELEIWTTHVRCLVLMGEL